MEYSEKWGNDVDEAVRLALEDLGLTEDQVMVTVLEEPTKGLLGIGKKLAKVRVEKIQVENEPEDDVPSGNLIGGEKKGVRDLRKKNKPQQTQGSAGGSSGRNRDNSSRNSGSGSRGRSDYGRSGGNRGQGGGRNRDYDREEIDLSQYDYSNKPQLSKRPEGLVEVENNEASVFLAGVSEKMKINVEVKAFENDDCVFIEVGGEDADVLIGKRGQTLDAIQYLTNLANNKNREEYMRVVVDIEGYRSRREKVLEGLAVKLAAKVSRSGRSVRLEPMNPYERKVIHATIQEIDGITTRSEGEEPYRKVIIEKER
jgi:spoIIIJ-associated protein